MNLRLVVDASIARSAGDVDSESLQANICTECLDVIDRKGYSIVLNQALSDEWRKHESRYSQRWYLIMDNDDRVITLSDCNLKGELDELINEHSPDRFIEEILKKDVHLVECSIATDNRIISLDKKARLLFAKHILDHFEPLQMIIWVVPLVKLNENCIPWLENGAPDEPERRLGYILTKK